MAGADTIERLRQFLRELAPQARSMLIGEIERSLLREEQAAGADAALHELQPRRAAQGLHAQEYLPGSQHLL